MKRLKSVFVAFSVTFTLLSGILYCTRLVPWIAGRLSGQWNEPKGEVLIVLGAEELGDGTLGPSSYWRAVYAVRAYRTGNIRRVVTSGGRLGSAQSPSLAQSMADFMVGLGVPREAIVTEDRSTSTRENALWTAEIVRQWPGRKVLLTSDVHMHRARGAFARAGVDVIPDPIPDVGKRWNSWAARWECTWIVAAELVKNVYYSARGWT